MSNVVVDASLAVKWLVKEQDSPSARALLATWDREERQLAAPRLLLNEVTNALHQHVRRGDLSVHGAADLAEDLFSDIEFHDPPHLHRRALELASELSQGAVYDCHYLALAEALGCELWTADQRFHRTASAASASVRALSEFTPTG